MTTVEKISSAEKLLMEFQRVKISLKGDTALREKAMSEFERIGIPSRKNEEYKYANTQAFFKNEYQIPSHSRSPEKISIEKFLIPELKANTIVLVNGIFSEELSSAKNLPKGVVISSLSKAFEKNAVLVEKHFSKYADITSDAFIALNTAFSMDGVFIFVPDSTLVGQPLHILSIVTTKQASLLFPRSLFVIGKGAQLQLVESTLVPSGEKNILLPVTEIFCDENSKTQFYRLQNDCASGYQISSIHVHQEKNSHFDTNSIIIDSGWIRNNLDIFLEGENCETHLNGLFITKNAEFIDNHTLVDHRKPRCQSNQLYKGILDGKSTGVFNGKIFVQPDAQKTNAYQSSKTILLSDEASMNTKPQLEIYADDVKCSHGSSTGQLNEEALFYLRARGLGENSARRLLLHAFANDVLDTIRIDSLKSYLELLVNEKLNG